MNTLKNKLSGPLTVFDGAMGTEIYKRNFFVNTCYEELSLTAPDVIRDIHRAYRDAGAEVLTTNTFNANARKLAKFTLAGKVEAINRAAAALAREVAGEELLVAGSVGPVGEAESAADTASRHDILVEQIAALAGVDFILFETIRSAADLRGVLDAVREFPALAYVVSFACDAHAAATGGDDLKGFIAMLDAFDGSRPTAIGLNCGGPESTLVELEKLKALTALPIIVQPNAGAPRGVDGRTLYMTSAEYFTTYAKRYADFGVAAIGGCCGIGPAHIAELVRTVKPVADAEKRAAVPELALTVEMTPEIPLAERSNLGRKLAAGEWIELVELVPPRGFDLAKTVAGARRCREAGIDAVNLPDGPRASARISSLATAAAIQQGAGIEAILHCCCRDRSLIGLQGELLGCAGLGIHNVLFITGDPPKLGDYPFSSGVFDVDSIGLVKIQKRMNGGIDLGGKPLNAPTATVIGVGADPNAVDPEREYRRTCEKVEAGAEYITTQPVYETESLFAFLAKIEHLHVPVIAGIMPLVSMRNAEFMRNEVPGVIVPDAVMRRMAAAGSDPAAQRAAGIAIAAESVAALRGRVAGVQVGAPFGKVEVALAVLGR